MLQYTVRLQAWGDLWGGGQKPAWEALLARETPERTVPRKPWTGK